MELVLQFRVPVVCYVLISASVLTIKHHLCDFFFSHKHITSPPPPLHTVFVCDLASGWADSWGKQNKAIWFLRPYTAPILYNRPGETTLSWSQSQHCSLVLAFCLSVSEQLTGHRPFKQLSSNLNYISCAVLTESSWKSDSKQVSDPFFHPSCSCLTFTAPVNTKNMSTKQCLFNSASLQSLSGPTHSSGYCLQDDSLGQLGCQTLIKWRDSKCRELNKFFFFSVIKSSCIYKLICVRLILAAMKVREEREDRKELCTYAAVYTWYTLLWISVRRDLCVYLAWGYAHGICE